MSKMLFLNSVVKNTFALAIAASTLTGCKKDEPSAPTTVTPVVPVHITATPYGTAFTGIPNREDAVIYQVNMRAFSQSANFAGVTARLDSIKTLGVNVIYLMPVYPVGQLKSVNSPYAVKDYLAVNSEFGNITDLRTLIDGAHNRGLAVMLDWVANHTSWDNAWITDHPDWYKKDGSGNIISPTSGNTVYSDVAQLDFSNAAMRAAMISAMKTWVYAANIDGFRYDFADNPPVDFWQQAVDTLRHMPTHPKLLLLAEGSRSSNFSTAGFDYNFGFNFYGTLKKVYHDGSSATTLAPLNASEFAGAVNGQQVVRYTTNHDVNGSDGSPMTIYTTSSVTATRKAAAMSAFVVASCYKGIPMIYNGQESGMVAKISFPFTGTDSNGVPIPKIQWDVNPDVTHAFKQLLAARASSSSLRHGSTTDYSSSEVCAFTKTDGADQAFVLANVRNTTVQYTVPANLAGTWTDALQSGTVTVGTQISLPPYGYQILRK